MSQHTRDKHHEGKYLTQGKEHNFGLCHKGGFDQVLEIKDGFTGKDQLTGEEKDEIFTGQGGEGRTSEAEGALGGSQHLGLPEPHLSQGSGFSSSPQPFFLHDPLEAASGFQRNVSHTCVRVYTQAPTH